MHTVVELAAFTKKAARLGVSRTRLFDLITRLGSTPDAGEPLGAGLFKIRMARAGGGKSGGYRVLYFFGTSDMPVFLLTVLAKNQRENFTPTEIKTFAKVAANIADTYGART